MKTFKKEDFVLVVNILTPCALHLIRRKRREVAEDQEASRTEVPSSNHSTDSAWNKQNSAPDTEMESWLGYSEAICESGVGSQPKCETCLRLVL